MENTHFTNRDQTRDILLNEFLGTALAFGAGIAAYKAYKSNKVREAGKRVVTALNDEIPKLNTQAGFLKNVGILASTAVKSAFNKKEPQINLQTSTAEYPKQFGVDPFAGKNVSISKGSGLVQTDIKSANASRRTINVYKKLLDFPGTDNQNQKATPQTPEPSPQTPEPSPINGWQEEAKKKLKKRLQDRQANDPNSDMNIRYMNRIAWGESVKSKLKNNIME